MSAAETQQIFLQKPCRAAYCDAARQQIAAALAAKVRLPLWLDEVVQRDERMLSFSADGAWLDVLNAFADAASYRLTAFDDGTLWIGPADRAEHADDLLRRSNAKLHRAAAGDERLAEELHGATSLEFIETPLQDFCDYVFDLHDIAVTTGGSGKADALISVDLQELPLHLALSLIAEQHGLDWDAAFGTVAIGPPAWVADFRRMAQQHRLDELRRSVREDAMSAKLSDSTVFEFVQTPLIDVADYLSDLHGVPVVADPPAAETPISFTCRGQDLAWSLSRMSFECGLAWHADDDAIYLCPPQRLNLVRQIGPALAQRRKNYPPALAEKLRTPVDCEMADALPAVAAFLAGESGVAIAVDPSDAMLKNARVTGTHAKLPLDVQLTFVAESLAIDWVVEGDKVVFRKSSAVE